MADFDGDGRLDLVVMNRRAPMELYRNITKDTGNWLTIALTQQGGNTNAVGATISVETPDQTQTQQLTIGGGHAGGKAVPLHFGIGDAATAQVTITWLDGTQTTHAADANSAMTITR
jgi:hypothetical protein